MAVHPYAPLVATGSDGIINLHNISGTTLTYFTIVVMALYGFWAGYVCTVGYATAVRVVCYGCVYSATVRGVWCYRFPCTGSGTL